MFLGDSEQKGLYTSYVYTLLDLNGLGEKTKKMEMENEMEKTHEQEQTEHNLSKILRQLPTGETQ